MTLDYHFSYDRILIILLCHITISAADASFVSITVNSRRKRSVQEKYFAKKSLTESATKNFHIDTDGLRKINPIETSQPDGDTVQEFEQDPLYEPSNQELNSKKEGNLKRAPEEKSVRKHENLLLEKKQKSVTVETSHRKMEEILAELESNNGQSLMKEYISADDEQISDSGDGKPKKSKSKSASKINKPENDDEEISDEGELDITIADGSGSMEFHLYPNRDLLSPDFKVIVTDTVKKKKESAAPKDDQQNSLTTKHFEDEKTVAQNEFQGKNNHSEEENRDDLEEIVEIRDNDVDTNCVFLGESKENPEVQVALTNCNSDGFVSIFIPCLYREYKAVTKHNLLIFAYSIHKCEYRNLWYILCQWVVL